MPDSAPPTPYDDPPEGSVWLPFTQMARFDREPVLVIDRAEGNRLIDTDGREYVDGVASMWAIVHGHNNPLIVEAIVEQTRKLQHSTILGITHEPVMQLARRLVKVLPPGLTRFFFSENGASAIEVALKMSVHYWALRGQAERTRIVSFEGAYHGDTVGAVSVGGSGPFRDVYKPLLFEPIRIPNAYAYRCQLCSGGEHCSDDCLDYLETVLREQGETVAAVIVEPRVQGAAGIIVAPPHHLARIRSLCDQYNVLLIADEILTGFGKTGAMFASDLEGVTPDIIALGKGITGGYLPLSATVTNEEIYAAFYADDDGRKFFHGHTYAGNPICCAAALASLEVFRSQDVLGRVQARADFLGQLLKERFADHPNVGDIRQQGLMVGLELVADRESGRRLDPDASSGWNVCLNARDKGVFIRPLGDTVVLCPPLSIEESELEQICEAVSYGIASALPR